MRSNKLLILMASVVMLWSCTDTMQKNPLLGEFNTPFNTPAFDKIKTEHFTPAFEQALVEARAELSQVIHSKEEPTFANTIEALEYVGEQLSQVSSIFFNLNSAATNDSIQQIALEVSPLLTDFNNDVSLNDTLFQRVKSVYNQRESLGLNPEQMRLLETRYKGFVRSGADLSPANKEEYRKVTSELANLQLQFAQNVLAATNAFSMHITDSTQLKGLPAFAMSASAAEAKNRDLQGWVFTLEAPSMLPFMQYADNRSLREKMWRAYSSRAFTGGATDNQAILKRITELSLKEANLLGFPTYADYTLEERMAGNATKVNGFLTELLDKSLPYATKELNAVRQYAAGKGFQGELMPWDFSYYSEKYKDEKYAISDEQLKPYFKLENAQEGIFSLAGKLYGITFKENKDIPLYHPDVKAFEVYDKDGTFLSVLYLDYFPRASKSGGAWMTSFRGARVKGGVEERPFVSVVCNFTKPTEESPSLLTFDEVSTLLHEFGHALHGMFAKGSYASLTGTNVTWDFVELPSQIMENWATEKEFLDMWAKHYQTGETIPAELVEKIVNVKNYLSGYSSTRQVAYAMNDMAWYSITRPVEESVVDHERKAIAKAQLLPVIDGTASSPSFSHIFAGGYAAGYYSYKWAEVLEADAFALFKEKGVFNTEVAQSFRDNVLSKGNSAPAMELYVKFRGHEPQVQSLFDKLGLH